MANSRDPADFAPRSLREVSVWVENLTDQELELQGTYARDGEPQTQLPTSFRRSAHLRWRCDDPACAFAVMYCSSPRPAGDAAAAANDAADGEAAADGRAAEGGAAPPPEPLSLSVGVVFAVEVAPPPTKAAWVRGVVGAKARPVEPGLSVCLQSGGSSPAAGRAPGAHLGRLLQAALPLGEGFGGAEGYEWRASRRDAARLEVRLKLLPQGVSSLHSDASDEGAEAPQESVDEEQLRRLEEWRQMAAMLDSQAAELEKMSAAEPLDPVRLRELPEMARVDLALALMMTLLRHRLRALQCQKLTSQKVAALPRPAWPGGARAGSPDLPSRLAKHALAVYKALLPLVGFDHTRNEVMLSKMMKDRMPGVDGTESDEEPSDPAEFCHRLALEVGPSSDKVLGAEDVGEERWSEDEVTRLCDEGSEAHFAKKVWLLEPAVVTSVQAAVRGLNLGILPCPGKYAVAYSMDDEAYYLLRKLSKRREPLRTLHSTAELPDVTEVEEPPGGHGEDTPGSGADKEEPRKQRHARTFTPGGWRKSFWGSSPVGTPKAGEATAQDGEAAAAPVLAAIPAAAHPRPFAEGTPVPRVWLAARQLLALLISAGEIFDARSRAALFELCSRLGVPPRLVARWEAEIGGALFAAMECSELVEKLKKKDRSRSRMKVAAAAVGGGLLCAVTGGLAAPAVAAGLATAGAATASAGAAVGLTLPGAIIGGALSTPGILLFALGPTGAAVLFGASGAGIVRYKLSKRYGQLQQFEILPLEEQQGTLQMSVDVTDESAASHLQSALDAGQGTLQEDALVPCAGGGDMALQRGSRCVGIETLGVRIVPEAASAQSERRLLDAQEDRRRSSTVPEATRFKFERDVDPVQRAIHLVVFVSGWYDEAEDFRKPWLHAAAEYFPSSGHVGIRWEEDLLFKLSKVFQTLMRRKAAEQAATVWWGTVAASSTIVSVPILGVTWPVVVVAGLSNLDNIWLVVAERASLAGECLAGVLCDKHAAGQRPVTLVGHSMGARVIFSCLQRLHAMGEFNVVADVVLLGTPVTTSQAEWAKARAVASGRVINAHWEMDWVLAFLYRYLEFGITVAGLSPVDVEGVENINLKGLGLRGHHDYPNHIDNILASAQIGQRHACAGI